MKEIWKNIKNYEGYYQVSSLGKVRSIDRIDINGSKIKGKVLSPLNVNGYSRVLLSKDGVKKQKGIHRLMMEAFVPNPLKKPQVNHINGIKNDNRLENLEWCDASENQLHAIKIGLVSKTRKWYKPTKKVVQKNTENQIIKIWDSNKQITIETDYKKENIKNCCNGKSKTAYGYVWKYLI